MNTTTLHIKLDWRLVSGLLGALIIVIIMLWQPWHVTTKTITVRGEASVEEAPDRFTFYATYQNADKTAVTTQGNAVVAQLKKLGVKTDDITTSVSAAGTATDAKELLIYPERTPSLSSYTITAIADGLELAQKVTDYLATTNATGQITPQAGFSKATRTKLDLEARRQAGADAKSKGQVMASQFNAKLGKVVKITEDAGYGIAAYDSLARGTSSSMDSVKAASPTLEPGNQTVTYVFTIIFELR